MPVQVAMPYLEDEGRNRTISSYGQEYSPVYVENMKRHLGEKMREIERYNRGETDPLEMPIGIDSGGVAALTKKEMLKSLGKAFGSELRYLKGHLKVRPEASEAIAEAAKEYKGRTKSLAAEIRSARELFYPVKEFNPASYESQWIPETGTLMLNSEEASPRQLRHELHHGYRDMYVPGNLNRYIRDYQRADNTAYNVATSHEKAFDAMSRKFGDMFRSKTEDISTAHGYHPEEIAAIKAEDIPLSTYKSAGDYLDKLYDLYKSALKERSAKESSIYRYRRLYKD
jgi:hypothetical protein